jgi:large subunit ribosomal protein L9
MKIILLKDVRKVGKKYDVKEVADGFAINMLIPHGEAIVANAENTKKISAIKARDEKFRQINEELLNENLEALRQTTLEIFGKMNDKGSLFAGVHQAQLVDELKKQAHIDLLPEFILLDKPIKEAGEHDIMIEAHGKKAKFKVVIKPLE